MKDEKFFFHALSSLVKRDNLSVYLKDKDLRYVYCSESYAQSLGVSPTRFLIGKTDLEVFSSSGAELNHKEDIQVIEENKLFSHSEPHIGGIVMKTNLVRKEPVYSDNREIIGMLCVIQTTDIHLTGMDTHKEKDLIEEAGSLGTWKLDLKEFQIEVSKGFYEILGYSNYPILNLDNILEFSNLEYKSIYEEVVLDALQSKKNTNIERKIITLSGEEKWLFERLFFQYDLNNQPVSLFVIVVDYTKIREYEKKIFEQNQQLENTLKQKTDELFDIIQHKNRLLVKYQAFLDSFGEISYERNLMDNSIRWNGDCEKILGYTVTDMPNSWKDYLLKIHPDDIENINAVFKNVDNDRQVYSIEYRILNQFNDYRWVLDKGLFIVENEKVVELLGIIRDIDDVKTSEIRMRELAFRDDLTGLYNRRGVFQLLETNFYQAQRYGLYMELHYCDLNDFKRINDELGHDLGDSALIDFANLLKKTLRKSDILGRVGGDEFIFFSVNMEPKENSNLEIRLRSIVDEFNASLTRPYRLSFSIGRVEYDSLLHVTPDDLIAEADFTMYQNKRGLKGSVG